MPAFLKRLGLEAFAEDEESYLGFVNHILANGKAITGYYGLPYINYHMGWAQLVGRIGPKVDGKYQFNDLDTHCAGICLWDVRIVSVMNDPENDDPLSKVLVVKGMDGSGLAVVHVVNADVLPSFAEDEAIRLQMIAFPEEISYYSDEEAYVATVEPDKFGKKLTVGENTLFPNGIFAETDKVPVKSITQIHGTVKKLLKGEVKLGEETFYPFIDCIVDTQFGEIEILHTIEDVDEAQRKHLKVGATVNCMCYLSGDAAMEEYSQGIVCNHDNHLKLLAYSLSTGDPERMRSVLADDFAYHSEASGKHIEDVDEFLSFVKFVQQEGAPCHPHFATLTECPEGDGMYQAGTRCLALSYGDQEDYAAIAFVDMNDEDRIQRIYLSNDSGYHFKVDEPLPAPDELEDLKLPGSVLESMLLRARFHGILPEEVDEEAVNACIDRHKDEFETDTAPMSSGDFLEKAFAGAFEMGLSKRGKVTYSVTLVREFAEQLVKDYMFNSADAEDSHAALVQALLYAEAIGYLCENNIGDEDPAATGEFVEYVGRILPKEALVGRNYRQYTYGLLKEQSDEMEFPDFELDAEEQDEDECEGDFYVSSHDDLAVHTPEKCWIKRLSALEDGDEAYYLIVLDVDLVGRINRIEILREEVTRVGGGFLSVPGTELPGESEFSYAEETPDEVLKELQMLFDGRYLTSGVSFIGKPYPQALLEEEGESYAVQSAFRLAYSHMSTELDDNNVIQELDYSTWQSTGTGFGDMFMRPVPFSDRKEELVDTLLYMIDRYSDDEWKAFMRNSDEDDQ